MQWLVIDHIFRFSALSPTRYFKYATPPSLIGLELKLSNLIGWNGVAYLNSEAVRACATQIWRCVGEGGNWLFRLKGYETFMQSWSHEEIYLFNAIIPQLYHMWIPCSKNYVTKPSQMALLGTEALIYAHTQVTYECVSCNNFCDLKIIIKWYCPNHRIAKTTILEQAYVIEEGRCYRRIR